MDISDVVAVQKYVGIRVCNMTSQLVHVFNFYTFGSVNLKK